MFSRKNSSKKQAENQVKPKESKGESLGDMMNLLVMEGGRNIGVIGAFHGVGTTTLTSLFAYYYAKKLKKRVSFTELTLEPGRDNLIFTGLGFDKRFEEDFSDIYKMALSGESLISVSNFCDNINFRISDGRPLAYRKEELENYRKNLEITRLISSARGEINLFDIDFPLYDRDFIMDFDMVVVVVDPLPSALHKSQDYLRYFMAQEKKGLRVIWVVNKMNKGVPFSQIKAPFKGRTVVFFPEISMETVYNYQYKCQHIYKDKVVSANFDMLFTKNSHDISALW